MPNNTDKTPEKKKDKTPEKKKDKTPEKKKDKTPEKKKVETPEKKKDKTPEKKKVETPEKKKKDKTPEKKNKTPENKTREKEDETPASSEEWGKRKASTSPKALDTNDKRKKKYEVSDGQKQPLTDTPYTVHVDVLVFRKPDYDRKSTRHIGLWVELMDDKKVVKHKGMMHVEGPKQGFFFTGDWEYDYIYSKRLVGKVEVGDLPTKLSQKKVDSMLRSEKNVPINNNDVEFNCQTWADFAVLYFSKKGWITFQKYEEIGKKVADYIFEAELEEE